MSIDKKPIFVGAPNPELKTSPILEPMDEDVEVLAQEVEGLEVCYFNGQSFHSGDYVCSGTGALLRCENGMWAEVGSCDPDNP